jgi:hypothetical protein
MVDKGDLKMNKTLLVVLMLFVFSALCILSAQIANPNSPNTTVTMPNSNYTVKANYVCAVSAIIAPATVTGPGGVIITITHQGRQNLKFNLTWPVPASGVCP